MAEDTQTEDTTIDTPSDEDVAAARQVLTEEGMSDEQLAGLTSAELLEKAKERVADEPEDEDDADDRLSTVLDRLDKQATKPVTSEKPKDLASLVQHLTATQEQTQAQVQHLLRLQAMQIVKDGVARNKDQYPQITKEKNRVAVERRAAALYQTGSYESLGDAFDDAVALTFKGGSVGTGNSGNSARDRIRSLQRRGAGMTPPKAGEGRTGKLDPKEGSDMILRLLTTGKAEDREKALRISREQGWRVE